MLIFRTISGDGVGYRLGHFLIAGDVFIVYILYTLFSTFLSRPMISTEYKWTVLILSVPFWCRSKNECTVWELISSGAWNIFEVVVARCFYSRCPTPSYPVYVLSVLRERLIFLLGLLVVFSDFDLY